MIFSEYKFSNLGKLWLVDLDGTVIIHNSHLNNKQEFTAGAREFLIQIPSDDILIFVTARSKNSRA